MAKAENTKSLRRKVRNSYIISTISIALVLFLLGSVGYLIFNAVRATDLMKENVAIHLMIKQGTSDERIAEIGRELGAHEAVKEVTFVPKAVAAENFKEQIGSDFVEFLAFNPLPDAYEVKLHAQYSDKDYVRKFEKEAASWNGIEEVVYQRAVVEQIGSNINKFNLVLLLFGGALLVIALILLNNTIRLKPKDNVYADGEVLAIVTIVTERYRTQYALLYTTRMQEAVTDKEIECSERNAYNNPAVSLSTADMTKYARQIWSSSAKYRNVATKMHRMVMRLNNIYSVGEYFFIDFSVENKTNIRFDIDEMRIKLSDKKQSKATNAQIVELTPSLVLDDAKTFKYGYRNVIVVKKMTFPNDKVLTIELSEKQISGRTISLSIDYEDVLSADSFNHILLEEE